MEKKKIIIGTRASILAVAQAEEIKQLMYTNNNNLEIELKKIISSGDKNQSTNLGEVSLKGLFVKEVEQALLDGTVDLAVHSMKDMPSVSPIGLMNACYPERMDNRDVLITKSSKKLVELPKGAKVGTTSLRRQKGILNMRPDVEIVPIRGNIHTRLDKLQNQDFDAIVLAAAGLKRVGLEDKITEYLEIDNLVPAPAQGILCVQCREDNEFILNELRKLNDKNTQIVCEAEREFSKIFDGGCHTPMGCSGKIENGQLLLKGMYYSNAKLYFGDILGTIDEPKQAAQKLADLIKKQIKG